MAKTLSKVKAKWHPPAGFFLQGADDLVKGLLAAPGGRKKAISRLTFYINRAGTELNDKEIAKLNKAKAKLAAVNESFERLQACAGVVVERAKHNEDPDMDMDPPADDVADDVDAAAADDVPADDAKVDDKDDKKKDKKDDEDEDADHHKLFTKIAKNVAGKTEDEIIELLKSVYDAGVQDTLDAADDKDGKKKKKDKKDDDAADDKSADDAADDKDAKDDKKTDDVPADDKTNESFALLKVISAQ